MYLAASGRRLRPRRRKSRSVHEGGADFPAAVVLAERAQILGGIARLRGRTATQRSKKGSEKALGRVVGRVLRRVLRRGPAMGFTVKRVLRRVLRSEKGVSRRCLERPLGEYAPLGVSSKHYLQKQARKGSRLLEFEEVRVFKVMSNLAFV